jgi:hypothetical protein
VKAWLAAAFAVVAMFAIATSCSINHRSDGFACTKPSDCSDGRECINGDCVVPNGQIDAMMMIDSKIPPDGNECPVGCTSCNLTSMTCNIDCAAGADCSAQVVCPAGWNCNIKCSVNDECRNGIDCTQANSCNLTCSGRGTCAGVMCGTGKCTASCTGANACRGVDCSQSCACDVTCANNNSACFDPGVICPAGGFPGACDTGLGCTSQQIGCNRC